MHRSTPVSQSISDFIAGTALRKIPARVQQAGGMHLLDGLATMLGGSAENSSRLLRAHFGSRKRSFEASVLGTSLKLPAEDAALLNGVQAHVLDYDDAQLTTDPSRPAGQQTHPTSPVLSAVLALAEARGASISELLAAYILGIEVACRLGDAIDPDHYLRGLHPTGTLGVFGAAAGSARLLKLKPREIRHALGIAATLSSGLRANRGTMAKALNAGQAAHSGVVAAKLARRGFSASENIFEEPMGFFDAFCPAGVDRSLLRFGNPFFFAKPGIAIKLYPCAGVLHPGLDAMLALRERHSISAEAIERVRVSLDARACLPLVYDNPEDELQARFSLPFAFAAAAVDGAAGLKQFSAARLRDPRIRNLMGRVELVRRSFAPGKRTGIETEIEIYMAGGTRHRARNFIARGHPSRPAALEDVEEKFRQCAAEVLRPAAIAKFLEDFRSPRKSAAVAAWLRPLRISRRR